MNTANDVNEGRKMRAMEDLKTWLESAMDDSMSRKTTMEFVARVIEGDRATGLDSTISLLREFLANGLSLRVAIEELERIRAKVQP